MEFVRAHKGEWTLKFSVGDVAFLVSKSTYVGNELEVELQAEKKFQLEKNEKMESTVLGA